jgi:hypothetical protein
MMISIAFRALLLSIRAPRDRAALLAQELLSHQEDAAAQRGGRAHSRWQREVDALARSILNAGRLGAAADGGLLSERRAIGGVR